MQRKFDLFGWKMTGEIPPVNKAVFIVAHHTSNWDGFWLIVYKFALNVEVTFLAKHTLFWWPLGPLLKKLGAIPRQRRGRQPDVARRVASLLQAQQGSCAYCGGELRTSDQLELAHRVARQAGGGEERANWQVLHRYCHVKKTAQERRRHV
ncbi:MAG: HNH endonuclease [Woeseiaceae bacterium]|nr:HNH endonuclease [Woeseiaceae bacterium]